MTRQEILALCFMVQEKSVKLGYEFCNISANITTISIYVAKKFEDESDDFSFRIWHLVHSKPEDAIYQESEKENKKVFDKLFEYYKNIK